jgi:hypothetical protein
MEVENPAVMWFGTLPPIVVVLCHAVWWQAKQSVFAAVKV